MTKFIILIIAFKNLIKRVKKSNPILQKQLVRYDEFT